MKLLDRFKYFVRNCNDYGAGGHEYAAAVSDILEDVSKGNGNEYLSNAFSLQMLENPCALIGVEPIDATEIPTSAVSCIGHRDTANVVSNLLKREIPFNRASITLSSGDVLYVAQVIGGRLPEGATTLPDGVEITFLKVVIR